MRVIIPPGARWVCAANLDARQGAVGRLGYFLPPEPLETNVDDTLFSHATNFERHR